ncbi:WecB/TagA/CpsF family glycosyltransferase [Muricauda sp. JGD-17]|uniref:WecB/TagA/CpsF family glycosyltransferase n=1 Tax=Flagellimonas ochracea TaxID=2696472 RepID=A0A964TDS8_9FLAO|nr:WecB/TagA/CpsF family glycosyltransferase [Allomuricauda ochracea]
MDVAKKSINGKTIYAFTSRLQFLEFLDKLDGGMLIALNAEKLNKNESKLDDLINSNIGYPDGIGAVLALRRKGLKAVKIPGAEFWLDIITRYVESKSFYFIGSTTPVIEQTITKLKLEFPNIKINGYRNGFFEEGDETKLIGNLIASRPDIVFVAMGSPRQELLMSELMEEHPALYMGLGGSFDVYVGLKKRAPKLYQKLGLEWFYRLVKEPTRISRQTSLLKFLIKIIFGKI